MPAIATKRFRIHNAEQFYESLTESEPSRYFVFIGRTTAFDDDNNPPTPADSVQVTEFDGYRDIIAMKRIQASDISYVIPRYNWTTGTVYKQYEDTDTSLYPTSYVTTSNTTFYVLTEDNNVYKCIDNNRSSQSTVKPTGTSTSIITTSDNYRWKFLYKISAADALKFLTTNYMPVKTLTANNGSAQWSVQQTAANGSIHHIKITANGTGYLATSNTFTSVSNATTMSLANNASGTDDIYNGSTLYISSGLGAGQVRRIVNYVAASKTLTVNGAFTTTPSNTSTYVVGPNVIIKGDSGQSSALRATAYVSNCYGGQIRKISMISTGSGFSTANVSFGANSSWGSGGTATPIISPPGGHGADPIDELAGHNIMISVQINGIEANTFPANNDFRVIGILRDPLLRGGPAANASVIDQCTRLTITGLTGDLTADEIITGGTSGAKSRLVYFANTNAARTAGIAKVIRVTTNGIGGNYEVAESITGSSSGKSATISAVNRPAVREYTGDIIYIENRSPITRTTNQIESLRTVVRF